MICNNNKEAIILVHPPTKCYPLVLTVQLIYHPLVAVVKDVGGIHLLDQIQQAIVHRRARFIIDQLYLKIIIGLIVVEEELLREYDLIQLQDIYHRVCHHYHSHTIM